MSAQISGPSFVPIAAELSKILIQSSFSLDDQAL